MILPIKFSAKKLALPFRLVYWSCEITKNDWVGVLLFPFLFVGIGIALFFLSDVVISRGVWFAMLWTSMTFAMLYHAQYRIQSIFDQIRGIIPNTTSAEDKEEEVRAKIYGYFNNKYYYIASAIVIVITFPSMHSTFITHYPSIYLQAWGWIFFIFIAFIGGYGMLCGVAFNKVIKEIIDTAPFELNPYHPDLFMGLKPLGNLSVANALTASSSSLLFPLIFETIQASPSIQSHADLPSFLGYSIFSIIMLAIIVSFLGPLFIIKGGIEKGKFAELIAHEKEYQERLDNYKKMPTANDKDILQLLLIEKAKLKEIRLFPFETKMLSQVFFSVLLPIVMLFLEVHFKK